MLIFILILTFNLVLDIVAEEGDRAVTSASSTSGKSRLASSSADLSLYLSPQGITRDCWSRLQESATAVFGAPDVVEEKANVDEYESGSTEEKVVWCGVFCSYALALVPCIKYTESVEHLNGFGIYSCHNKLSLTSNSNVAHYSSFYYRLTMIFLKEMWMI